MTVVVVLALVATCCALAVALQSARKRAVREQRLREFFASRPRAGPGRSAPATGATPTTATTGVPPGVAARTPGRTAGGVTVAPPEGLPTFREVGGMDALKRELRDTVGLLLGHSDRAAAYGITWNGLLLHGPPGVGKTFLARATAGEFGLRLVHVSTGDLAEGVMGASARNVKHVFETAAARRPCLLLFDEFDSVAQRRDAGSHAEERRTVNQLLTSLEQHRSSTDLVVVAVTNDLDHLDPAVIRPGRFDRHIRVGLPDAAARRSVLATQLAHRPACHRVDLDGLAHRMRGLTPAAITQVVDAAALAAFREAAASGEEVLIATRHLEAALAGRGGDDRPQVEDWDWDDLVLDPGVEAELRQLQAMLTDPDLAERFGVEPPRGLLLAGPPGTGKTTIGRVLAAQAGCSFYPVSSADVTSRWVGESERSVKRLFERARARRPSIVFIDEIDALATRRSSAGTDAPARQLTQLLVEMDGLEAADGVLVIGATNRPELLDEALVRGGRLSRTITLTLPDAAAREAILARATARMPTVGVDLTALAARTSGWSGADLKALCQHAALQALVRTRVDGGDAAAAVLPQDFDQALADLGPGAR